MKKLNLYVAVDIGCIECGESSAVLGCFTDESEAKKNIIEHEKSQKKNWSGQHVFKVFCVEVDKKYPVDYKPNF